MAIRIRRNFRVFILQWVGGKPDGCSRSVVACSEVVITRLFVSLFAGELKPLVVWCPLLVLPQLPIRHVVNVLHRLARRFGNLFQRTLRLQFRNYFWFDKVRLYFFVLYLFCVLFLSSGPEVVPRWSRER